MDYLSVKKQLAPVRYRTFFRKIFDDKAFFEIGTQLSHATVHVLSLLPRGFFYSGAHCLVMGI